MHFVLIMRVFFFLPDLGRRIMSHNSFVAKKRREAPCVFSFVHPYLASLDGFGGHQEEEVGHGTAQHPGAPDYYDKVH